MSQRKILALILLIIVLLTGCKKANSGVNYDGVNINTDDSADAIENLTITYYSSSELSDQNAFHSRKGNDFEVLVNLYDGLLSQDANGNTIPAIASSWEASEDFKTWIFHLRDDVWWVNMKGEKQAKITSDDFITGLEWALNYGKNEGGGLHVAVAYIEGADRYYHYTLGLGSEKARKLDRDVFTSIVGICAPDDYTLVYTLKEPCSYFDTVVIAPDFYPASRKHIEEIGIDGFLMNYNYDAWYNGPYLLTEFISGNERILDPNPYWIGNEEHTRFKSITGKAVENSSIAYQLYTNGEADKVVLSESHVKNISENPNNKYHDYLVKNEPNKYYYQYLFNFRKYNEDGSFDYNWNKAISNEAFRLSWYYGFDYYSQLKMIDSIDPYSCEVNTVNPYGLPRMTDGRDYTDVVKSKLDIKPYTGTSLRKKDKQLFEKYKALAIKELTAIGVEFPIKVVEYVKSSEQAELDSAIVLKNSFRESFGDDYIQLEIKTYVSSLNTEVLYPKKYSFALSSWGPDFGDPSNTLSQILYGDPNAYFMEHYINLDEYSEDELKGPYSFMQETVDLFKTYTAMIEKAFLINDDSDARYEAFAEAEAYLISHAAVVPGFTKRQWLLTKINVAEKNSSCYGLFMSRLVDIKTDKKGYDNSIWKENSND